MSNIEWTVSILAQYSSDKDVVNAYRDLTNAIINQSPNTAIQYFIFKYNIDNNKSTLVTIEYNQQPPHKLKESDLENFSLFDPESISDKFTKYTLSNNSNRHLLITWGHAAGFGYFREGSPPEEQPKKIRQYKDILKNLRTYFANGIVGFDNKIAQNLFNDSLDKYSVRIREYLKLITADQPFKILPVDQLSYAIQKSFGKANKKVDVLYMMNCCMQTFETGYALMPKVEYLIGSENFSFFLGIDYKELFREMHSTPNIDIINLSRNITQNLPLKYKKPEILDMLTLEQEQYIQNLSLSVNRLSEYPNIFKVIEQIAEHFLNAENKNDLYKKIKQAREECKDVNYLAKVLGIIDFTHFCKCLKKRITTDQTLIGLLDTAIAFTRNPSHVIINSHLPSNLCNQPAGPSHRNRSLCPHGFSIFFPKAKEREPYILYFMKHFYHISTTSQKYLPHNSFTRSKWVLFVNEYFNFKFTHQ